MIQCLGIVAGLFAMLAAALLFGESSQGGSTAGISGFPPYSIPVGVSVPLDAVTVENLGLRLARQVVLPPLTTTTLAPTTTTTLTWAGTVGFDRPPPSARQEAEVVDGTGVRIPAGPHLDLLDESGSPVRATDTTTDKEVSAVPTTLPEPVTREYLEGIVREYFPGDEYEYAAAVVACESSWNPDAIWTGAKNKTPQTKSAAGLFQFIQRTWVWVAEDAGVDPDPAARLDPVQATQAARHLVDRAGGGWSHWECAP